MHFKKSRNNLTEKINCNKAKTTENVFGILFCFSYWVISIDLKLFQNVYKFSLMKIAFFDSQCELFSNLTLFSFLNFFPSEFGLLKNTKNKWKETIVLLNKFHFDVLPLYTNLFANKVVSPALQYDKENKRNI